MTGARARARQELTAEITAIATRMLDEEGIEAVSLRAVTREMGMVSSAIYRYFPTRDALLTVLIVNTYDAVGALAEEADASVKPADLVGRWLATTRAVRHWAIANPRRWALIFGSPVPGYAAPQDTIDPAARIPFVLLAIVGAVASPPTGPLLPKPVRLDLTALRTAAGISIPDELLTRALMAWTHLVGAISFELFGHLHNVITDFDAWFTLQMKRQAESLGL